MLMLIDMGLVKPLTTAEAISRATKKRNLAKRKASAAAKRQEQTL